MRRRLFSASFTLAVAVGCAGLRAEPIAVRRTEGVVHGFLVLRTLEGKTLADGELIQFAQGDLVTSRLLFRFRDGSLHDETAGAARRSRSSQTRSRRCSCAVPKRK